MARLNEEEEFTLEVVLRSYRADSRSARGSYLLLLGGLIKEFSLGLAVIPGFSGLPVEAGFFPGVTLWLLLRLWQAFTRVR